MRDQAKWDGALASDRSELEVDEHCLAEGTEHEVCCPSLGSSTKPLNHEVIYTGDQVITKGDFDQIPVPRLRPFRLTNGAFSLGDVIRPEALVGFDADGGRCSSMPDYDR